MEGKGVRPKQSPAVLTTMQAVAYMQNRRTAVQRGDFLTNGRDLFIVADFSELVTICWRIRQGVKVFRVAFNHTAIMPISPLEGIYMLQNEESQEPSWSAIIAEIEMYGANNRCIIEKIVVPAVLQGD